MQRWLSGRRTMLFCSATCLLLLCVGGLAQAYTIADYYPLNDGNQWVYHVTGTIDGVPAVDDVTCTVNGFLVVNGVVTSRIIANGVIVNGEVGLVNDGTGLSGYGGSGSALWFPQTTGYVDPAWVLAPADVSVGQSWTQTVTPYVDGIADTPVTAATTLVGVENIWVPAGSFAGCLVFEVYDPASPETPGRYWLAPGVGLVKASYSDPDTGDQFEVTLKKAVIVTVALTTDKVLYHRGDRMTVWAAVANDGPWTSVHFLSWLELPNGNRYAGWSADQYVALPQGAAGEAQILNIGALPRLSAGTYTFRAELRDPKRGTLLSSDSVPVVYQ